MGIYISHIIWRIRYRKLRKEAKTAGISIDDLLDLKRNETQETQNTGASALNPSTDIEKQSPIAQPTLSTLIVDQLDASEKC